MTTDTASHDQRKRTLEALERRFAVAKAELLQQQKKSKSRPDVATAKDNGAAMASPGDALATPSSSGSSKKKGHSFFPGYTASQAKDDTEENGLTYLQLAHPVHENLLTAADDMLQRTQGKTADKILHELLQHGDSALKYMQGSRNMKIDNWILLDNYVKGRASSMSSHVRALRTHSKRSKKRMSMKQHKKCGTFDLPPDVQRFDLFKPMHEMWKGYMTQLLKTTGKNQLAQCLLNSDLQGAIILVAESKISSLTGVSGIMIRETAKTFGIITQDNKFRVVPKKVSVFIFQVDCWKITLHGEKLTSRNLSL